MKKIITFIHGFCMALADSVPGVSGGTVAFLLGFYDRFVDSLDDLISGTKEKRITAIRYLIKLGIFSQQFWYWQTSLKVTST